MQCVHKRAIIHSNFIGVLRVQQQVVFFIFWCKCFIVSYCILNATHERSQSTVTLLQTIYHSCDISLTSPIDEHKFMFTLRHKRASTVQRITLCLAQKPTESSSLCGSEHCRESCAFRAHNPFILHEHARNHAHFVLHYCHGAQVCTSF